MNTENKVTIQTHWFIKAIAILSILIGVLFIYAWISAISTDGWQGTLLFGFLGGLLWVLASSYIEMTDQHVLVQVPYGRFKINWDEVTRIETNGTYYAFIGEDKRIVIAMSFANSAKRQMYELMKSQAEKRKIEIKLSGLIPLTHKNSRVTH